MGESGIEHCAGYVAVDCRGADARLAAERSRAFAVECIEKDINRVLIDATDCDPEGHAALRDAFTTMILAGIPPGFRLAMITNVARLQALFGDLQRDLLALHIHAKLFTEEADAVDWLRAPAAQAVPARNGARQQA